MVTRKDVAKRAGVSEPVVSYVINNSNYVSLKTREKVEAAIRDLGYKPNLLARSLKTNRSHQLAFICNDFNNPFFSQMAAKVTQAAYDNGYMLSVNDVGYNDERINLILQYQVDGIFICSDVFTSKEINTIVSQGIPVVLTPNSDYPDLSSEVSLINTNLYEGMSKLMEYLAGKGHENFAFVSSARININDPHNYRFKAFKNFIESHDGKCEVFTINTVEDRIGLAKILDKILKGGVMTAVVSGNDAIAIEILNILRSRHIRVPEDLAVAGFDNIRFASMMSPRLTTVDVHIDRISLSAIEMLLNGIQKKKSSYAEWESDLIEGESA